MQKIKLYIQDSILELTEKVSWPTWSELQSSAIIVMVASMIIAILIFIMDTGFQAIMHLIYGMFN
jgi:preprotein translocase subunit SecE